MRRPVPGSTRVDPTQPGIPAAAYTDKSAQPATPAVTYSPPRGAAQAPAGAAGYNTHKSAADQTVSTTQHRSVRKEIKANVTRVADLAKHASDAGLLGVAEAAGRVLGELTPASGWRQELLQIRVLAGLLLAGMLGYAFLLAPRKLGWRGEAALVLRGCSDNALSFVLFNMLGIMPALLASVAWPVLRNENAMARPMWPYLTASFGTGAFALLSYLVRWDPPKHPLALPPTRLVGSTAGCRLQRLSESRILPALLLASTLYFYTLLPVATPATWAHFGYLIGHSLTVRVMLIDFSMLTLLSAWLVVRDASARGWAPVNTPAGKWILGVAMVLAPAIGPGVYLLVRPVSVEGYSVQRMCKDIQSLLQLPASWVRCFGQQVLGRGRALAQFAEAHGSDAAAAADRGAHRAGAAANRAAHRAGGAADRAADRVGAAADRAAYRAGVTAARTGRAAHRAADVAAAAATPLPSALSSGASAVSGWAQDTWSRGWLWVGQKVARLRGGGAAVASSDDAAGAELDIDGRAQPTPPGHTSASAGGTSGTPGHTSFWHRQPKNPLGPGPSPVKARSPGGGMELLFDNEYDEYDADLAESDTSDNISDDITDEEGDEDDELDGEVEVGTFGAVKLHDEDHQPADEDEPEIQDEDEDELFDEPLAPAAAAASSGGRGVSNGAAAGASSGGSSGRRSQRWGDRATKAIAVKRLSDLGVQEHPWLRGK